MSPISVRSRIRRASRPRKLPIRRIDFDSEDEVKAHDRVVKLTRDLEAATTKALDGLSAADRSLGARRAEAAQDELDELALDLYCITDPEQRASVLALGAPIATPS